MNGGKAAVDVLLVAASRVESGVFIRLLHELAPGRLVVWRASNLHFARRLLDEAPIEAAELLAVVVGQDTTADADGRLSCFTVRFVRGVAADRVIVLQLRPRPRGPDHVGHLIQPIPPALRDRHQMGALVPRRERVQGTRRAGSLEQTCHVRSHHRIALSIWVRLSWRDVMPRVG